MWLSIAAPEAWVSRLREGVATTDFPCYPPNYVASRDFAAAAQGLGGPVGVFSSRAFLPPHARYRNAGSHDVMVWRAG